MPLKLNTASSGSVTLDAANTASNFTLTVPAQTGTVVASDSSGNVGIGTSSPNEAITIQRGGSAASAITMRAAGNTSSTECFVGQGGDSTLYLYNRSNNSIVFGVNNAEQATLLSNGNFRFNSGYGSVATVYGCRAWVNFNGTGTVAIRASGNVSSITDNGTGNYTVNFSTSMPDANYSANVSIGIGSVPGATADNNYYPFTASFATGSIGVAIQAADDSSRDYSHVTVSVHR